MTRPQLAPLWDELHRRFGDGRPPSSVTLRNLDIDQQRALADLLARDRLHGATARVRIAHITDALGLADVDELRALVEARRGPIVDRRALRRAARDARDALWEWLGAQVRDVPLMATPTALAPWIDGLRTAGIPGGDIAAHRALLARVVAVLHCLPRDGVSLAGLADDMLGDPHALDPGRAAARIVLDAVALCTGRDRPADAEEARLSWEDVGVVPDPLSSSVLVLGVRPAHEGPMATWLCAAADASEPVALTLAQLRRWPLPPLEPDAVAFVVENPSLLAEAASRPWRGPPLVCSSGRPTVAVVTLLRQLGAAGSSLRQHADFDRTGVGITSWLTEHAGTRPWGMNTDDYLAAVLRKRTRPKLRDEIPDTPWDPPLRATMQATGLAVQEEEVRAGLLDAMSAHPPAVSVATTAADSPRSSLTR
jgi:uncharacterized protein (TIGR02679 family)